MWVRGLKPLLRARVCCRRGSHPMWVRGLKLENQKQVNEAITSHPMWVRGLKHNYTPISWLDINVAPYVGAWIETF